MNEPKNYRAIMLSSTFTDLKRHREQVIKAIREFEYKAEVMEESGARADVDVIDSSLKMARDSVAYALIIGRKYGQTPICPERNPDRLSITELEFNEAMRLKRPILLFIMDNKHPVIEEDVELDRDKRQKLDTFRERAKRMRDGEEVQRVYETFESLEQFSIAAAIAIGKLVRQLEPREAIVQPPAPAAVVKGMSPPRTLSNIPINVPLHFLGRDEDLAAIDAALKGKQGRAAITTALHGLRGVGKTTLAAAYAEQRRSDYRATWWIRAETIPTMRADLVGLGVRLGWVVPDEKEEPALVAALERLRDEGDGILLVYDNANNADEISPYVPRAGAAHIIVTSNAPNWSGVAAAVEIEKWPKEIGADYLGAQAGRPSERDAALALSEALDGLPLAHEQAAAYCARTGLSLANYQKKFEAEPTKFLDAEKDASPGYHNRRTAAKTFALAIDEAAKLHPAAEPLIVYAALLAPEPIPLFMFSETREELGEPLTTALAGDGLDETVAALRAFALIDREMIPDERDPTIKTDCIRLHRLVRQVAVARREGEAREDALRILTGAVATAYPSDVYNDPKTWPRARRLDALALALVAKDSALPNGVEAPASYLLNQLALYRHGPLAAFAVARPLLESSLSIYEKTLGPEHPHTATGLNNLGYLLRAKGDHAEALVCYERALAIREKVLGPDHPDTAASLNNLGQLLQVQGDLVGARLYFERALAISEKALGAEHPNTGMYVGNLATLLQAQDDLDGARPLLQRAFAIHEKVLGPEHPYTATSTANLAQLLEAQGDYTGARLHYERALAINEKTLGSDHPVTATSLHNLGNLLQLQGSHAEARLCCERALAIYEKAMGSMHSLTQTSAYNTAIVLDSLGCAEEAAVLREKYGIDQDKL